MMSAEEARQRQAERLNETTNGELQKIENAIALHIGTTGGAGESRVIMKGHLCVLTKQVLKDLGYEVDETDNQYEGAETIISW